MEPISTLIGQTATVPDPAKDDALSQTQVSKEDFLRLLVAQLEHQDPLNPMEGTEFTAQLAQFSSLEQLINVNKNLGKLGTLETSMIQSQAVGMLGKQVLAEGNTFTISDGVSSDITFSLDGSSDQTMLSVLDANGGLVTVMDAGPLGAGQNQVPFSGRDGNGNLLPDGVYTYSVLATDADGKDIGVKTFSSGLVGGVTISNGVPLLSVGPTEIPLSSVVQITEPKPADAGTAP